MASFSIRKNVPLALAGILLSLGGLLILQLFTGTSVVTFFNMVSPGLLLTAAGIMAGVWGTEALRIAILLRALGNSLPLVKVLRVVLATNFVASITPAAAGGPPAQTYFLARAGVPLEKVLAVVTWRLLLTFGFFAVAVPLLLFGYRTRLQLNPALDSLLLLAIGLLLVILVLACLLVVHPAWVLLLVNTVVRLPLLRRRIKDPSRMMDMVTSWVREFSVQLRSITSQRRVGLLVAAIVLTIAYWLFFFALAPVLLAGMGFKVPYDQVMMRQIVFYFLMSYVPLPGAGGVAEVGLAGAFYGLVPTAAMAGFVAWWRVFTYYSNLAVGGLTFLSMGLHKEGR